MLELLNKIKLNMRQQLNLCQLVKKCKNKFYWSFDYVYVRSYSLYSYRHK